MSCSRDNFDLSLYLVTDRPLSMGRDIGWIVREAVEGGCTMVQLREKDCDTREFIELASQLKAELSPLGVPLLINDRIDVALAVDADGVHIGQSDMPYETARRLLGPDKIIGLSVENMDELDQANALDVDYIGISPIFGTKTKTDTKEPFGLEGAREVMSRTAHPAVGIGGMNHRTAADVMKCGVDGIAVVSDIVSAPSPKESSRELLEIVRANAGTWTESVWNASQGVIRRIEEHPFQKQIADGTLPMDVFGRYVQQDRIYMTGYSKEMRRFAELVPEGLYRDEFLKFAEDSMAAEHSLHIELMDRFGLDEAEALPLTKEYMAHTGRFLDNGDLPVALASILPCMWIYNEIGHYVQGIAKSGDNPFQDWIDCYSSKLMDDGIPVMRTLADDLASKETTERRSLMRKVFMEGLEFEYRFWDQAFKK